MRTSSARRSGYAFYFNTYSLAENDRLSKEESNRHKMVALLLRRCKVKSLGRESYSGVVFDVARFVTEFVLQQTTNDLNLDIRNRVFSKFWRFHEGLSTNNHLSNPWLDCEKQKIGST